MLLALSVLAFAIAFRRPALPVASAVDAPLDRFSGQRALVHIRAIAGEPRPTGSPALARAREYLIGELRDISPRFQLEVQEALVVESFVPGIASATRIKNIVARLPGTDSTRTLLLLAHYDSVVNAPGANDDGAGVGVALELARALHARGEHRNDIVLLLTDGEERGMLGARAYYQQHPRGQEPLVVFNFEARGNSGLALLFQTGPDSEWLVRDFARLAPTPAASSVSQELFRILPYGTDFSVFAKGQQPGLNFAYINNTIYYHSAFDTPETVDVRSLQHHGDNVLELLTALAQQDLRELLKAAGDGARSPTYFLLADRLLVYGAHWNSALLALAWLLYLFVFAGVIRRARPASLLWQTAAPLIVGLASALFVWLLWRGVVLALYPDLLAILPTGETYRAAFLKSGLQCAGLAFGLYLYMRAFIGERQKPAVVMAGALAFWLLVATACVAYAPGAAYLFLWPTLLALPGCALVIARRGDSSLHAGDLPVLAMVLPALALLLAPIVRFLFYGLLTTTAQPAAMLLYAPWLFFLALPLAAARAGPVRRWLLAVLTICALIGMVGGARAAAFGIEQPRPNSLFYVYDASRERLARFSCDARLDPWTRAAVRRPEAPMASPDANVDAPAALDQETSPAMSDSVDSPALGDFLPVLNACLPGLHRPASAALEAQTWRDAGVRGPQAELLRSEVRENGDRELSLRIRSRRGAPQVYAFFRHSGEIRELRVDGEALPESRLRVSRSAGGSMLRGLLRRVLGGAFDLNDWSGVMLASSGKSSFLLSFVLSPGASEDAAAAVQLRLVDHTNGLRGVPGDHSLHQARAPDFVPGGRFPFSDGVFVVEDYRF